MRITNVKLKNFKVFKGDFTAKFCPGVNVLRGENGTGKTTLLNVMYAHCRDAHYACCDEVHSVRPMDSFGAPVPTSLAESVVVGTADPVVNMLPIYFPGKDVLEHAKSLKPRTDFKGSVFDDISTQVLLTGECVDAREQSDTQRAVSVGITNIIGGRVEWVPSEGAFYTVRVDGGRTLFSDESSGVEKLGHLEALVRSGQLQPGSILFWDAPENDLHTRFMYVLTDMLLILACSGVQIFIVTYSDDLAEYLSDCGERCRGRMVKFITLYKKGDQIERTESDRFTSTYSQVVGAIVTNYEQQLDGAGMPVRINRNTQPMQNCASGL
jgi:hypothetical protein